MQSKKVRPNESRLSGLTQMQLYLSSEKNYTPLICLNRKATNPRGKLYAADQDFRGHIKLIYDDLISKNSISIKSGT